MDKKIPRGDAHGHFSQTVYPTLLMKYILMHLITLNIFDCPVGRLKLQTPLSYISL